MNLTEKEIRTNLEKNAIRRKLIKNAVSCDYILRETYAIIHICLFQLKKEAGVIGETGVLATRIVQRKEKDSVLQMILKNVQELTEIVLNYKRPNVQWMNAMVNKPLSAIKI